METRLEGIAAKARQETDLKFTSLCHHVTRELIWESLCHIPHDSAPGVDGITVDEAKKDFGVWIDKMFQSMHRKGYRVGPLRRA
jgi:RNA-directed DNA polymerase